VECQFGVNKKIKIMKLEELVPYLMNSKKLEKFLEKELNQESEALLIYMLNELDLKSEISIFEIEETDDDLVFEKDGETYIQLFPIEYAIELIESDLELKDNEYSDLEIAQRLLEYRIKDA
jgi:hypothetical protein